MFQGSWGGQRSQGDRDFPGPPDKGDAWFQCKSQFIIVCHSDIIVYFLSACAQYD